MPKEFIIPLQSIYPFGQYTQKILPDDQILVQETFKTSSRQITQDVKTICTVRRAFAHPNLINIKYFYSENNIVKAYYQYVHLKAQINYFQLDSSLEQKFTKQLFDLINCLKQATIKFQFQPENLGIGINTQAKYFLRTFQIGCVDLDHHYQCQKKKISEFLKKASNQKSKYFDSFSDKSLQQSKKSLSDFEQERRQQKQIFSSISTSHSSQYQQKTKKIIQSQKNIALSSQIKDSEKERKSLNLIDLIQDSKRKSLQVLKMYRKIKGKQ